VLLSDENDFFFQGKHRRFVRIGKGEQLNPVHFNNVCETSPQKMFWSSFSFSGTGSLKPIGGITHSHKCIGVIEKKVITDMRSAFSESEGNVHKSQIIDLNIFSDRTCS